MEEKLLPKHIAIIMDGNRRWAKEKGLDYRLGHKEGAETLRKIAKYANKLGVKYLTVYAFSTENWKRTKEEVGALMILLQKYLEEFLSSDDFENIKVNMLGNIADLDTGLQKSINKIIEKTKNNTGLVLNIAFNYGGRDEIVRAVRKIAEDVKENKINVEDINEQTISNSLILSYNLYLIKLILLDCLKFFNNGDKEYIDEKTIGLSLFLSIIKLVNLIQANNIKFDKIKQFFYYDTINSEFYMYYKEGLEKIKKEISESIVEFKGEENKINQIFEEFMKF